MKMDQLKFDTPNNACLSLRIIAEWVRSGEVVLHDVSENYRLLREHVSLPGSAGQPLMLTINRSGRG